MKLKATLILIICIMTTQFICAWTVRAARPVLTDETCDLLCNAAQEKSRETGLDISFAVADADGLPRRFLHFGDVLVLSATLVPAKAYTSAITQTPIGELVQYVAEGGNLMGMNTCNSCITLVPGGIPLFVDGKIVGAIGIG